MNDRRVHQFRHLGQQLLVVSVATSTGHLPLTPAELAVARLAARGLSNEEIARQRGRAVRTVANQVAAILQKLRLASRAQLVSVVQPDGP
jgi:DNA-binding NarL/FixJ family response regulator